jgi:hypothetical protein
MVVLFDLRTGFAVCAALIAFVFITDTIFTVIVTYIFVKPVLNILKAAGGHVHTPASRALQRTKWWNFAGVLVTVGSSTLVYINLIAYLVLTHLQQYALSRNTWANPTSFGLTVDSILNTIGMMLLCGMFKDVHLSLPKRITSLVKGSSSKIAAAADINSYGNDSDIGFVMDSPPAQRKNIVAAPASPVAS